MKRLQYIVAYAFVLLIPLSGLQAQDIISADDLMKIFSKKILHCYVESIGHISEIINIDYSEDFVRTVTNEQANGTIIKSPVVSATISTDNYIEVNDALAFNPDYTVWTEAARQYGIRNSFAKGKFHRGGKKFVYHCFTNNDTKFEGDFQRIFKILFPHLDNTILRLFDATHKKKSEVKITNRELEVLRLLCLGCVNKEIANKLNISLFTVKSHLNSIFYKLDSKNRTQTIIKAMDLNLLQNFDS